MSARYYLLQTIRVLLISAAAGSLVAFFLVALDMATNLRWEHPWLLYLLPVAGLGIWYLYHHYGKNSERGNNLLLNEIQSPDAGIPRRMAPLVLASTLITHLFGGSAGREGTAVQIGGSMAASFFPLFKISPQDKTLLISAGMAAGFGAVFGTPVTGAIFALEVVSIGNIRYRSLLFCMIAGYAGHLNCMAWGVHHTLYKVQTIAEADPYLTDPLLWLKAVAAGVAFGLAGRLFAWSVRNWSAGIKKLFPKPWLVPVAGGIVMAVLGSLPGAGDYLGLGVHTKDGTGVSIINAFQTGGADTFSWAIKLAFTAITLGSGFKGGEVTPLFFIGATLGNVLAPVLGVPVDLFAGLGFIAVFCGATNTPIACTLMGAELFGGGNILYFATACVAAYMVSGHKGIYSAQTIAEPKSIHK